MTRTMLTVAVVLGMAALDNGNAWAADVSEGQRIYHTHCSVCHGMGGVSVMPNAPNFGRGERLMQADSNLLATIKSGKMAMPAFNGILRDQQILDVIAYLRTLQ